MAVDQGTTILRLDGCSFSYRNALVLSDISLSLQRGRLYGLIGPNGSGKTTLINLLAGTAHPGTGSILLHGRPVHDYAKTELARQLSLVPQAFAMEFDYTVYEVVMMGRHPYIGRFGSPGRADEVLVLAALSTLDIMHLRDRFVTRLSGGERQRVLVARALAQNTGIMILDEATASLDIRHSIGIMQALRTRVEKEDVTIVAAIHDLDLAAAFCDELVVLNDGTLHAAGSVRDIMTQELIGRIFGVEADIRYSPDHAPHIHYNYSHA